MSDLKLRLWCEGMGINPSIIDSELVKMALTEDKDTHAAMKYVLRDGQALPGQTIGPIGAKEKLEFLNIADEFIGA